MSKNPECSCSWLTRDQLLQRRSASDDTDTRLQPFVVSYTRDLEATHINRSIHSASVVLPPHLQLGRRLVSWRAASTTEPAHDDEGQLALEGMMASAYPSLCSTYPQSSTAL
jgi:hypothetical protein